MTLAVIGWLVAVNLVAVVIFAADKRAALAGRRRVPERTLLGLAVLGAAPGLVWATYGFRHKTRKEPFRTFLRMILLVWVVLIGAAAVLLA